MARKGFKTTQSRDKGWILRPSADDMEQIDASRQDFEAVVEETATRTRNGGVRKRVVFEDYEDRDEDSPTPKRQRRSSTSLIESKSAAPRRRKQTSEMAGVRVRGGASSMGSDETFVTPNEYGRQEAVGTQANAPTTINDNNSGDDSDETIAEGVPPRWRPLSESDPFALPEINSSNRSFAYVRNFHDFGYDSTEASPTVRLSAMMRTIAPQAVHVAQSTWPEFDQFGPQAQYMTMDGEYTMFSLLIPSGTLFQIRVQIFRGAAGPVVSTKSTIVSEEIEGQKVVIRAEVRETPDDPREEYEEFAEYQGDCTILKCIRCTEEYIMFAVLIKDVDAAILRDKAAFGQTLVIEAKFGPGLGSIPTWTYENDNNKSRRLS